MAGRAARSGTRLAAYLLDAGQSADGDRIRHNTLADTQTVADNRLGTI